MPIFRYTVAPDWPPLAWLATCRAGASEIEVIHGCRVETKEDWFCEAVWDARFSDGDFDQTDVVFGSGARLRDGHIHFVSSSATVDRLHVYRDDSLRLISNSLPCIVRVSGACVIRPKGGYIEFFTSIGRGVEEYRKELPLSDGCIRLVYFRNLRWDGSELSEVPKPVKRHRFTSFGDYRSFMEGRLVTIGENMRSEAREWPYSWLGAVSRGFDSPTCVTLARPAGLTEALTFAESRPGVADDGRAIGEALGIATTVYERLGWQGERLWEPLFVVADGQGKEISLAAADRVLEGRVLLTGHAGGYVWSVDPKTATSDLHRGQYSGLSVSEYRLHRGFIHLPAPFIGMLQAQDIVKISRSDEMGPWRRGGPYDRPVCARILDEAGVPGSLYGHSKTGNSVRFVIGDDRWSPAGKRACRVWAERKGDSREAGGVAIRIHEFVLDGILRIRGHLSGLPLKVVEKVRREMSRRMRDRGVEDVAFEWALDNCMKAYGPVVIASGRGADSPRSSRSGDGEREPARANPTE